MDNAGLIKHASDPRSANMQFGIYFIFNTTVEENKFKNTMKFLCIKLNILKAQFFISHNNLKYDNN